MDRKSELMKKLESLDQNLRDVSTNVASSQRTLGELKRNIDVSVNDSSSSGGQGQISASHLLKLVDELKTSIECNIALQYNANFKLGQLKQLVCDSSQNERVSSNSQMDHESQEDNDTVSDVESSQETSSKAEDPIYIPSQTTESSQSTACESSQSQSQSLENIDLSNMDWRPACLKLWEILWNSKFSTCLKEVNNLDDGLAVMKEQLNEKFYKTANQFRADVRRKIKKCKENHTHGEIHENCLELEKLFNSYMNQIIPEPNKPKNRNSDEAGPSTSHGSDSDIKSPAKKRKVNRVDSDSDEDDESLGPNLDGNGSKDPVTPSKQNQQNKNKIKFKKLGDDSRKCIFLDDDKLTPTDVLVSHNHQPLKRVNLTARILKVFDNFHPRKELELKRFIIGNDDGVEISCIAWEGQARKYDEILKEDRIVRIENAITNDLTEHSQCKGVFYELKIYGETEIYMKPRTYKKHPKE